MNYQEIKEMLKKKKIVITPMPKEDQFGPASIDLTLSNEFYIPKTEFFGKVIDLEQIDYKDYYTIEKKDTIMLKPGELILGKTLERIRLSDDVIGFMDGRSRFARLGLAIHVTSSIIQPGSNLRQILEIVNLSGMVMRLRKGMRITQVTFQKLNTPTKKPYHMIGNFRE